MYKYLGIIELDNESSIDVIKKELEQQNITIEKIYASTGAIQLTSSVTLSENFHKNIKGIELVENKFRNNY